MLLVVDLAFDYPHVSLFNKLSFSLQRGQLLHLQGQNGAGKTTLLKILAGLIEPSEGSISYQQQAVYSASKGYSQLAHYQKNLCYVGHKTGIHSQLTVRENCFFEPHCALEKITQLQDSNLATFDLLSYADEPAYQLSAGQRRRLALTRLLMSEAKLWLLDEPFTSLDVKNTQTLLQVLQKQLNAGGQVVLTSHQPLPAELAALEYFL